MALERPAKAENAETSSAQMAVVPLARNCGKVWDAANPPYAPELAAAVHRLAPGVLVGYRRISVGDENALLPGEAIACRGNGTFLRRQSGAARLLARQLLETLGVAGTAIPRFSGGAPVWPAGIVGSLAHDPSIAAATVGRAGEYRALGIDVEPAAPLPPEIMAAVTTPGERGRYGREILESRLLFVIKEAVYKAVNPLDGAFLDFQDVEVDLVGQQAHTRTGRTVAFAACMAPRVVALAFIRSETI